MTLDRSIIPTPLTEESFKMPSIERFSLNNSLKVFFIKKKELPIVRINLVIQAGSKFDPVNKKGISNLLTMCIDEGAGKYNSLELSEQFDLLGASFSLYSDSDNIHITLQTLKENFKPALELLSLVITKPHFSDKDFEREKRRILTKLKQLSDEPDYVAKTAFDDILFGKQNSYSFPSLGLEENISTVTSEEIKTFYTKSVLPNNSFIVITGDIDAVELIPEMNEKLADWKSDQVDLAFQDEIKKDEKKIYIVDKKDSVQTEIRAGHHTTGRNSKDYFNKLILNTILGGQFTSRINHNLREKNGYTYGAGSAFNYYMNSAYFGVSTCVGTENTAHALREIFYELSEIKKGITQEELSFAKASIIRKFPSNFETCRQVASNIIGQVIFNLPEEYFSSYIKNIKSVTADGVNKSAAKYIHPDLTTTVLVGDKEKLHKQLSGGEFGDVEFV